MIQRLRVYWTQATRASTVEWNRRALVSLFAINTDLNNEIDISKQFTWKNVLAVFWISHFAEHIHPDLPNKIADHILDEMPNIFKEMPSAVVNSSFCLDSFSRTKHWKCAACSILFHVNAHWCSLQWFIMQFEALHLTIEIWDACKRSLFVIFNHYPHIYYYIQIIFLRKDTTATVFTHFFSSTPEVSLFW